MISKLLQRAHGNNFIIRAHTGPKGWPVRIPKERTSADPKGWPVRTHKAELARTDPNGSQFGHQRMANTEIVITSPTKRFPLYAIISI